MFQKAKINRTQITDLPQFAIKLQAADLDLVSGGLRLAPGGLKPVGSLACSNRITLSSAKAKNDRTDYSTGGDHDPD